MSPELEKSPTKTEITEPKLEEKSPKCEPIDDSAKTEVIENGNEVKPDIDGDKIEEKKSSVFAENSKAEVKTLPVKR
jgi:hypothetical protein